MKVNEAREYRQKEGVYRWIKNKCNGILAWATGVGKTYGAILAIQYIEQRKKPIYLITVPSQVIANQWWGVLKGFFPEEVLDRITIKTVKELQGNSSVYIADIHIVDEIHEYTTDDRIKLIDGTRIQAKARLGLTASITDFSFKRVLQYLPIVDEINELEAKDKNFISQFHEYNMEIELTTAEKEEYDRITEIISLQMPKFNNDLDIANKCLFGGNSIRKGGKDVKYYTAIQWATTYAMQKGWSADMMLNSELNQSINNLWHPNKIVGYARQLMKAVRDRKYLLEHSINKFKASAEIIAKFNQVKIIVFSENTDMVDALFERLKDNHKVVRYHSNLETIVEPSTKTGKLIKKGIGRQKTEAIDAFKSGRVRVFLSTRAVDKGLNVPDIRLGLTISGSSKTNQYEQRGGRVKRLEDGAEEDPTSSVFGSNQALLINLYIKDTQDEKWLRSRQKHVGHFIHNVTSIDEITYTPPANDEFVVDF